MVDTGNIQRSFEIDTTKIQAMVVPVEESTTFNVTVAAMTSVGIGPYSEPIILTTLSGIATSCLQPSYKLFTSF